MSRDAAHTTWGTVRPRIEREIEAIKSALVSAPIEQVPALQARAQALESVRAWFEAGAPDTRIIMDDSPTY